MIKILLLLPTNYNDGKPIESEKIQSAVERIDNLIGGHTLDGSCQGCYRMDSGEMATDICLKIWAVCNENQLEGMQNLASDFAVDFGQESIYFERTPATVDFIRAKQ